MESTVRSKSIQSKVCNNNVQGALWKVYCSRYSVLQCTALEFIKGQCSEVEYVQCSSGVQCSAVLQWFWRSWCIVVLRDGWTLGRAGRKVCTGNCEVCCVQCVVCSGNCAKFSVQSAVCSVSCAICSMQLELCRVHCVVYCV